MAHNVMRLDNGNKVSLGGFRTFYDVQLKTAMGHFKGLGTLTHSLNSTSGSMDAQLKNIELALAGNPRPTIDLPTVPSTKGSIAPLQSSNTSGLVHVESMLAQLERVVSAVREEARIENGRLVAIDRKSTRLNSSHSGESRMPSSA